MRRMCLAWLTLLVVVGCNSNGTTGPGELGGRKIRAVTTTTMITDLVRHVGGERTEVVGLMGPGVDPHLYEPSAGDLGRMERADLVFYNGLHLEGQMGRAIAERGPRAVALSDGIDPARLRIAEGFQGGHDPHIWFDVELWMATVPVVRDRLSELDPDSAALYQSNASTYLKDLAQLHADVRERVAQLPKNKRVMVTAHDAFGYFGRAYDFEVHGLQGVSTEAEAGVADVQRLADFIVERKVPVIFVETSVNPKNLAAVQQAARARGFDVKVLRDPEYQLCSDALGQPGTATGTYIGMVRHNVDLIVRALGAAP